ncbi:Hypothetical protein NTJ_04605 [Nesidiocoris tenuis]|uniref:Uncharacterized protein n=1 Tax=Nesidiocoris tenuis TaxID=355587 RepID=A0ABN7AHR1_9HEMI|nr:Hypothetical protein NTJ_04605 [Nesidiocoris tenuis]
MGSGVAKKKTIESDLRDLYRQKARLLYSSRSRCVQQETAPPSTAAESSRLHAKEEFLVILAFLMSDFFPRYPISNDFLEADCRKRMFVRY